MRSITRTHIVRTITFLQRAALFGAAAALLLTNLGKEWSGERGTLKRVQTVSEAYFVHGRIMQLMGDPEAAIASYQESLAHNSQENPYALNNLALILIQRGWFNEAVVLLEKAVAQKPDVVFFHHNLGIALQHTGNFHKALAAFQAALMIDPHHVKAQISLNEVEKQLRLNREYPSAISVAE